MNNYLPTSDNIMKPAKNVKFVNLQFVVLCAVASLRQQAMQFESAFDRFRVIARVLKIKIIQARCSAALRVVDISHATQKVIIESKLLGKIIKINLRGIAFSPFAMLRVSNSLIRKRSFGN